MIEETLASEGSIGVDDFARIHMDSKSLLAASYQPLLATLSSEDERVSAALETLRVWDLQLRRDSVGATLWEIFYMHLALWQPLLTS